MPGQVSERVRGREGDPLAVALALLHADAPGQITGTPAVWPRWAVLLPHVLAATSHLDHPAGQPGPVMDDAAWLLDRAASYLRVRARAAEARPLQERALAIDEAAFDLQILYNKEDDQASLYATITDSTPLTVAAILDDTSTPGTSSSPQPASPGILVSDSARTPIAPLIDHDHGALPRWAETGQAAHCA